ncbi:DUF11 domain-containing protein [Gaiella sp.]|uniref:DUF11 domain-containing protein n=1 Tax=Gaiella sp. TaxID=2663207 RepID=UPI002BBF4CEA|nr:DUF11 domain-containing protein [Gaiella sp.]HWO80466.1 DUF11 domain-containing protein [Gaiella sp.]
MHFIRDGRLRRLLLTTALVVVAALGITSATSARVDVGSSGSATFALTTNDKVTLCHAAGRDGTTQFVTLTISYNAAFGQAGHFYENGTPRAGHEDDYLGPCNPPPPTDVCPNIEGNQADVPAGMIKNEQGNCVTPTPPTDVCPNIEGNQADVPAGMIKNEQGNCVTPTTPTTPPPPSVKSDEFMDVRVGKDATPQVQLVNGQADITYTVRVRNEGPNQAHEVSLVDAAPTGVTFLAVTQPPAGSCTVTSALLSCALGTLGPGVERSVVLTARVTQTGTYVNSATATGNGKDTNGANNTDDASTLVTAPATPPAAPAPTPKPVSKPRPRPHVSICRVLKVTPGMVKANGNRQLVVAKVTHSRNPVEGVAVHFGGKGLSKVVRTNAEGVARISIAPRTAGIMLVKITSAKACNTARIGVIGAFEPPVTG